MHVLGSCRIRKFPGQTEPTLSAEVELISTIAEKKSWTRPPIQMEFQVSYWLSFIFSVLSCSNFTLKWLRMGSVTLGSLCTRSQHVLLFFLCTSVFNFCCYRQMTVGLYLQVPMFTASGLRVRFLKVCLTGI